MNMKKIISTLLSVIMLLTTTLSFSTFADGEDGEIGKAAVNEVSISGSNSKNKGLSIKENVRDKISRFKSFLNLELMKNLAIGAIISWWVLSVLIQNMQEVFSRATKESYSILFGALGVSPGAKCSDIDKAFRSASKYLHPDKVKDPEAKKTMGNIFMQLNKEVEKAKETCVESGDIPKDNIFEVAVQAFLNIFKL
ncbi:MAG: hypothetical protein RUMPE_00205 [Eubacteriales bacterium SKADARSKE-1]|nr:hypothetical protein [Eubacteriales bacterium SKADARSKE-1]